MRGILYNKKKYQQGGVTPMEDNTLGIVDIDKAKAMDTGVSRQSGRTVFVGPGLDAPPNEVPVAKDVYDYKKVGVKGAKDYINVDDLKSNPAYDTRRKNYTDSTNYTEADYIRDANARLQQQYGGENWRYKQVGNRLYTQQAKPTDYKKYEYSTGH